MEMIPPQFIIIPYQLIEDDNIKSLDERVYGIIYWLTQLKGEKCTASNPTLAKLCRTTPNSLKNSLTKLERGGYIYRDFKDEKRKVRSEIKPLIIFTKVSSTDDRGGRVSPTDDTVSPTDDTKVSPTDDQNKSIIKKSNKEDGENKFSQEENDDFEDIEIIPDESVTPSNKLKSPKPKYPNAKKVFTLFVSYDKRWDTNTTQLKSAEALYNYKGLEKIKKVLSFYNKHQDETYCPQVTTPNTLNSKWEQLINYIKKSQ